MLRSAVLLVILIFTFNAFAADRVVLLAPAAADIMLKLRCGEKIIGKTKSVEEFPDAMKVGSHIRPNIELIMSLEPDLIIIPSNRFFTEEMVKEVGVPVVEYNPATLEGVLEGISDIARLMDKVVEGDALKNDLRVMTANLQMPNVKPRVMFEVMQIPYTVAGEANITADIIRAAGGDYLFTGKKKMVRYSMENTVASDPDIYFYQVGPMNKNPEPPEQRAVFKTMTSEFIQVDEKEFSRANTQSFENVVKLNKLFTEFAKRQR